MRERTHWNIQNITARHPVLLGLCGQMIWMRRSRRPAAPPAVNPDRVDRRVPKHPRSSLGLVHQDLTPGWVCMVD